MKQKLINHLESIWYNEAPIREVCDEINMFNFDNDELNITIEVIHALEQELQQYKDKEQELITWLENEIQKLNGLYDNNSSRLRIAFTSVLNKIKGVK